jgi:bifunctional DNase/RNase
MTEASAAAEPTDTQPAPAGPSGTQSSPDGPAAESSPVDGVEPEPEPAPEPEPVPPMGDFPVALIASVSMDLPNQHPKVVLRETESPRRQLNFSIGLPDAVALSHALRRIPTPRPLTHELLTGILQGFDIDVVAVRLVGRQGAVYFAELDLRGRSLRSVHACRPSDALTVALHQPVPVPILIDRRLFEEDGDVKPAGSASA